MFTPHNVSCDNTKKRCLWEVFPEISSSYCHFHESLQLPHSSHTGCSYSSCKIPLRCPWFCGACQLACALGSRICSHLRTTFCDGVYHPSASAAAPRALGGEKHRARVPRPTSGECPQHAHQLTAYVRSVEAGAAAASGGHTCLTLGWIERRPAHCRGLSALVPLLLSPCGHRRSLPQERSETQLLIPPGARRFPRLLLPET